MVVPTVLWRARARSKDVLVVDSRWILSDDYFFRSHQSEPAQSPAPLKVIKLNTSSPVGCKSRATPITPSVMLAAFIKVLLRSGSAVGQGVQVAVGVAVGV